MRRIKITLSVFITAITLNACYYDNLEELYPPGSLTPTTPTTTTTSTCDTASTITYTSKISTTLQKYCTGCHTGTTASGGIDLSTYNSVKTVAQTGKLLSAVTWDGNASQMPKGGSKISACEIETIKKWINTNYAQ